MNIYQKILAVQAAVGRVPKTGFNSFHKYNYVTEADLMDAVRDALMENKLAIVMTGMDAETGFCADGKRWARVKLNYLIADAEGDQVIETSAYGYAEDSFDKAIYKAETGACKYLYYKLFMVSTGDDPEREEQPSGKAGQQPAKKQQTTTAKTSSGGATTQTATKQPIQAGAPENQTKAEEIGNLIVQLYQLAGLTKEQVKEITGLSSILAAMKAGNEEALQVGYNRLEAHLKAKGAA